MKFGKVADLKNVDFRLPQVPEATNRFLAGLPNLTEQPELYIGATGWSMREWMGTIYPKGTKSSDYLKIYSQQFNTIEFNTTHYRIPTFDVVEKWKKESTDDFKFCPKVPQHISHRNDMGIGSGKLELFLDAIAGLEEKLGACFLQLPPYFGPDRTGQLIQFLNHWPIDQIQLCIEFRQADWFNTDTGLKIFEELRQRGFGTVITDVAGRRDVLHLQLTTNYTLVRFVGNGLIASDLTRMDEWKTLLDHWASNGLSTCYFFPHQPDNLQSPEAAELFGKKMNSTPFSYRYPNLINAQNSGQLDLF